MSSLRSCLLQSCCLFVPVSFRVLAAAWRPLEDGEDWRSVRRCEAEKSLRFLGLFVFENKLKADAKETIEAMKEAQMDIRILTGDSPHTAIGVAAECGILDPQEECITTSSSSKCCCCCAAAAAAADTGPSKGDAAVFSIEGHREDGLQQQQQQQQQRHQQEGEQQVQGWENRKPWRILPTQR